MIQKKPIQNEPIQPEPTMEIYRLLFDAYGPCHWWPAENPFEVMIGALLTQNTNWQNVEKAISNLKSADMLSADAIAACELSRLETLIRPSGYFRQKASRLKTLCRFYLQHGEMDGLTGMDTTSLRQDLLSLNGVGPETADSILLYALDRPIFVIDAYTRRIFARLGLTSTEAAYYELQDYFSSHLPSDARLFNEYHALIVVHAKQHCRLHADCAGCPLGQICSASQI